ncbi:MAG: ankyrin repeat domain-containing protein [Candidatus Pacebacteria bacterium]|nr:ankyrin repeat domain-containing protein [Candidatus Paceibacterota bacterium]
MNNKNKKLIGGVILRFFIYAFIDLVLWLFMINSMLDTGISIIDRKGFFLYYFLFLTVIIIAFLDLLISLIVFLVRYEKKDPKFKKFFFKVNRFCSKYRKILLSILILVVFFLFISLTKLGYIKNYLNIIQLYPNTALIENVEKKDLNKIKQLIRDGFNVDATDEDKQTALMTAADNEEVEIVKELIKAGANVNATDIYNKTVLTHAIQYDKKEESLEIAKELIKAGANVNAKVTNQGLSILIISHDSKIIKELINAGADVNAISDDGFSVLMSSISREKSLENIRELIKDGADVNAKNDDSALMFAIRSVHPEIALELIKAGADVNAQNDNKETALMIASAGNIDIVKELIKNNADINIKNDQNMTALDYAINYDQPEIINILKQAGAKE